VNWFDVLKAARKVGSEGKEITAEALANHLTITPAVASAWLGKFARWGYVLRVGRDTSRRGRPQTVYVVTRWGMEFKAKAKVIRMPRRLKVANPKKEE
jgi:predicted ArsR family transcriptional regulator